MTTGTDIFETALHQAVDAVAHRRSISELSLTQATELLDWLEAQGVEHREVTLDKSGTVTVRWGASPNAKKQVRSQS